MPFDIPGPIQATIDKFTKFFPNLDTSLFDLEANDKDLWFLKNLEKSKQ